MAKFFKRESLFTPKHVAHKIGDQEMKFHPVSLNMLWKLRTAFEPVIEALRVLTAGKNDVERTVDQGRDDEGNERTVTHMGAVTTEMAKLRQDQSDAAWKRALDCIFGEDSRELIGELLADSLRDDFTREEAIEAGMGKKVIESLDLGTMVEMVNGLLKANAGVFGPFAEKVRKAAAQKMDEVLGSDEAEGNRTGSQDAALEATERESVENENESSSPRIVN